MQIRTGHRNKTARRLSPAYAMPPAAHTSRHNLAHLQPFPETAFPTCPGHAGGLRGVWKKMTEILVAFCRGMPLLRPALAAFPAGCRQSTRDAGNLQDLPRPQVQLLPLPSSSNLDEGRTPRRRPERLATATAHHRGCLVRPVLYSPSQSRPSSTLAVRPFWVLSRNCLPTGLGDAWREMAKGPVVSIVDLFTLPARLLRPLTH